MILTITELNIFVNGLERVGKILKHDEHNPAYQIIATLLEGVRNGEIEDTPENEKN